MDILLFHLACCKTKGSTSSKNIKMLLFLLTCCKTEGRAVNPHTAVSIFHYLQSSFHYFIRFFRVLGPSSSIGFGISGLSGDYLLFNSFLEFDEKSSIVSLARLVLISYSILINN